MIDSINIEVFSDSDVGGLLVNAIETSERSGDFISTITLSSDSSSSGNRLYAIPGDTIFAKYDDHTLPKPFSKSDNQYVETFAKIDHSYFTYLTEYMFHPIFLSDGFGNPITSFLSNIQMQIVGSIENKINYDQEFIYFFSNKNF